MKEEKHSYIKGLLHGIGTLLTGMKVTGREFFTPKVTEQYPENRATLKISPRSEDGLSCRLMRMVITNVLLADFARWLAPMIQSPLPANL